MIKSTFGTRLDGYLIHIIKPMSRMGISPNALTVYSLVIGLLSSCSYGTGYTRLGGLLLALSGICDLLDGPLARFTGSESKFGAFIDSVIDRYSEIAVATGLCVYFAMIQRIEGVVITGFFLMGSMITSYAKARGENFINSCDIGLIERAERIVILSAGSILGFLIPSLFVLAVLANYTAIQRIFYVKSILKA